MSITSITSLNASQPTSPSASVRAKEDAIGRQLEQAIQSGDLAGAQQAYSALSAFGPNNSGPFSSPALSSQFAAVGEALQNGDLGAAKQAADKLGKNLLQQDLQVARHDFRTGDPSGAQQAITNLKGDYWAVTGQAFPTSPPPTPLPANPPQGAPTPQQTSAINVQA